MKSPIHIFISFPKRLCDQLTAHDIGNLLMKAGSIHFYNTGIINFDEAVVFGSFSNKDEMFNFWISNTDAFHARADEMQQFGNQENDGSVDRLPRPSRDVTNDYVTCLSFRYEPSAQQQTMIYGMEFEPEMLMMAGAIYFYNAKILSLEEAVAFGGFDSSYAMYSFWLEAHMDEPDTADEMQRFNWVESAITGDPSQPWPPRPGIDDPMRCQCCGRRNYRVADALNVPIGRLPPANKGK